MTQTATENGSTDALVDVLRTLANHVVDLSRAVEVLVDCDALRAERIKDLSARIDYLEAEALR